MFAFPNKGRKPTMSKLREMVSYFKQRDAMILGESN